MKSFSSLNSLGGITYEDTRTPGIVTDRPRAFNIQETYLTKPFAVENSINITEVIQPDIANVRYEIDATGTDVEDITWPTVPGTVASRNGQVWTLSGIDSAADWELVKNPQITMVDDYNGRFTYTASIRYNTNTVTQQAISWDVEAYVPYLYLESEFGFAAEGLRVIYGGDAVFDSKSTFEMEAIVLQGIEYTLENSSLDPGDTYLGPQCDISSAWVSFTDFYERDSLEDGSSITAGQLRFHDSITGSVSQTLQNTRTLTGGTKLGEAYVNSSMALVEYAVRSTDYPNEAGEIRLYNLNDMSVLKTWTTSTSPAFGTAGAENFSVAALTDTHAVIVATYAGDANGAEVRVYNLTNYALEYTLLRPSTLPFNGFNGGWPDNISASSDYLVTTSSYYGYGYLYDVATGTQITEWVAPDADINPSTDADLSNFGSSIAIGNQYVVIGASGLDYTGATSYSGAGAVYVYELSTQNLVTSIYNNDPEKNEENFGQGVATDDLLVYVGIPGIDFSSSQIGPRGKVLIYDIAQGEFQTLLENPDVSGTNRFGANVLYNSDHVLVSGPVGNTVTETQWYNAFVYKINRD